MRTGLLTYLALAVPICTAFDITLFSTDDCTGNKTKPLKDIKISDGCKNIEGDITGSAWVDWSSEDDNAAILVLHRGDKCCIGEFQRVFMWQDECLPIIGGAAVANSIRVVNPEEVEKGPEGEDYMCLKKS
jgi:hypothetical protein